MGAERHQYGVGDIPGRGGDQGGGHVLRGQRVEQVKGPGAGDDARSDPVGELAVQRSGDLGDGPSAGRAQPGRGVLDRPAEHVRPVGLGQGPSGDLLHRLPPEPLGVDERAVHVEQHGRQRGVRNTTRNAFHGNLLFLLFPSRETALGVPEDPDAGATV